MGESVVWWALCWFLHRCSLATSATGSSLRRSRFIVDERLPVVVLANGVSRANGSHVDDVANAVLPSDELNRMGHAFEDWSGHFSITELFKQLVGDVGRGKVWQNQHIGGTDQLHEWIIILDSWIEGGITLHRSVDHQGRVEGASHDDRFFNPL